MAEIGETVRDRYPLAAERFSGGIAGTPFSMIAQPGGALSTQTEMSVMKPNSYSTVTVSVFTDWFTDCLKSYMAATDAYTRCPPLLGDDPRPQLEEIAQRQAAAIEGKPDTGVHDRSGVNLGTPEPTTRLPSLYRQGQLRRNAVATIRTEPSSQLIRNLGWSREQAMETRARLRSFEEDWNAPGMEGYDEL